MVKYELKYYQTKTSKEPFIIWYNSLDKNNQNRILSRLIRMQEGNFGDHKKIDNNITELRLSFGSGYRIYYTIQGSTIIILLTGGDKSTQSKDISKAKEYVKILKGKNNEQK